MSVLICYDGSPGARNAIAVAARTLAADEATILHVWTAPAAFVADSFGGGGQSVATSGQLAALEAQRTQAVAEAGRQLASQNGLEATSLTACNESTEWETILHLADSLDSTLIVVGAHRRDTPGPTLSSTSAAVAEHSHRPVLIVPLSD